MTPTDLSILIADDNEMNRWLLAEQLQNWSQDIVSACEGRQAWRFLENQRYSLVFLDVNMPGFNGFELVKKIRAESANRLTPVIAVTAHVQNDHRHLLIAEGFNDCLIKPLVLADLQRVISQWCESTVNLNSQYYADAILDKFEHNQALGQMFLQKLFKEAPTLFANLAFAFQNQQAKAALENAHKLHGSFCFYGFADFRVLAESLEQSVMEENLSKAWRQFHLLSAKFEELVMMKADIMQQLTE